MPYDQLTDGVGPLAALAPGEAGIVLVENARKASLRPYHKQKLALVLANQRHFALEQARRGVAVRYVTGDAPYREILSPVIADLGPLAMMEAAERELRRDLAPLVDEGKVRVAPHEGWLTTAEEFAAAHPKGPPWQMGRFYRVVRKATGILMEDGAFAGGKLSFDVENRNAWRGDPPAPEPPSFPADEITEEVAALVASRFARHPGTLTPERLPATAEDAARLWAWAREACLPHFGPYQDAMSRTSPSLFHTRISALLHLHRLLPRDVVADVLALPLPIASLEGFVRQILGWREFVRHVHRETDGLRTLPGGVATEAAGSPGDGGYARWRGEPWIGGDALPDEVAGLARPSALGSDRPLPPAWWGVASGFACLDGVVADVWRDGYGHHITRLMVLANLAALLDVSPREITDWFWAAYTDAYDWAVEPNVLGMGTYAVGGLMTTKPYVAGAAYVHRMGDYCASCRFDPKRTCPFTRLYWAYLARHGDALRGNHRLALPLRNAARRDARERAADAAAFETVSARLLDGEAVTPEDVT